MARTAWEIMTAQGGGSVRRWSTPGLDQLGARAPSEGKGFKGPRRKKSVAKPARKPYTYADHRERQDMDLLDEINNATGVEL